MASCKNCVHVEVCSEVYNESVGLKSIEEISTILQSDGCDYFRDRSRFVELTHAEWVEDEDICGYLIYRCSNCNERFVLTEGTPTDNCYFYCPSCGAKMDEQALKERENND